jgi:predicted nucleic acid-binding protein
VISPTILEDPKDDMVLACALGGKVDFIISGDDDLLRLVTYESIRIWDVNRFLEYLSQQS